MSYPGGKNGPGVYQSIINLMPPHRVYIEPFLGSGAVLRMKRPAEINIGLDLDTAALWQARGQMPETLRNKTAPYLQLLNRDAFEFLERYPFTGNELVYCDPPYMMATRSSGRLYRFELTDEQHARLLGILRTLRNRPMVMLSGYDSKLYRQKLSAWQHETFSTTNRAGQRTVEHLWFNFPHPTALHDYRYLGDDFRERERIKRKRQRWAARLARMSELERRALLWALQE